MTQIWDSSPRIKRLTHQEALKMPPSWFKRHLEAIRASGGTAHPMAGKRGVVARINRVRLKCGGINSASGGIKYTRVPNGARSRDLVPVIQTSETDLIPTVHSIHCIVTSHPKSRFTTRIDRDPIRRVRRPT
jgi:hypothetical protein